MNLLITQSLTFLLSYYIPKLLVATLCGGIIGLERELKHRSAGLKTNVLICVGSTLFTSTGLLICSNNVDRVVSQIISGIGFLGAGAIFKSTNKVRGLTTAAFIWVGAAIGIIVGCGGSLIAIILSSGCVVTSLILNYVEKKFYNDH